MIIDYARKKIEEDRNHRAKYNVRICYTQGGHKEERRNHRIKSTMSASATQGGHNNVPGVLLN